VLIELIVIKNIFDISSGYLRERVVVDPDNIAPWTGSDLRKF
jgi:hypothetical protein